MIRRDHILTDAFHRWRIPFLVFVAATITLVALNAYLGRTSAEALSPGLAAATEAATTDPNRPPADTLHAESGAIVQANSLLTPVLASHDYVGSQPALTFGQGADLRIESLALPEVAGRVLGPDGLPLPRAWVTDGTHYVFTDAQGDFVLDPGAVFPGTTLTVFSSGYREATVKVRQAETLQIALEPHEVRGIYLNPLVSGDEASVDRYIHIANTTEVNAVVVDIKDDWVFYDTNVALFRHSGAVNPHVDIRDMLRQFHDSGIYVIARLVVFKDSFVAEANPDLALRNNYDGGVWRDVNGTAWVDPTSRTLWQANIDLAVEAANIGFDEIQYDYVRFPTDGDLSGIDWPQGNTQEVRESAINAFLERSYERIIPTGARLSADIFGYTVMVPDDLNIGQNFDELIHHVDYASPMLYPSHWPTGSIAVPGVPNDYPYETVAVSMEAAIGQVGPEQRFKLRPWLQDFTLPEMTYYDDTYVRAQIQAVEDAGLSGWLLWDPSNAYHTGALRRETVQPQRADSSVGVVGTPVERSLRPRRGDA